MEAFATVTIALVVLILAIFLIALFAAAITPTPCYHDWWWWHRRQERLERQIDDLNAELRSTKNQPAPQPPALPAKQIVEHRHVHVHVGAEGQPVNPQKLLAPPPVQAKAQELHGIPVQVPGGWNIERNGRVLLEMRKPKLLEMRR